MAFSLGGLPINLVMVGALVIPMLDISAGLVDK